MAKNLYMLPTGLPEPENDGACDHLPGMKLPSLALKSTSGQDIDPSTQEGRSVIFCYPMTGKPERPPMIGWNKIPGARGCTTQCCSFRDRHFEYRRLGVALFGLSAQPLEEQQETVKRLRLSYPLLNDSDLAFADALDVPTFRYESRRYIKRLTLLVRDGVIEKVYYPVFPPHLNATDILEDIKAR